jgi:anti-sigma regulatory factor (Ser/Thr protein kinase)
MADTRRDMNSRDMNTRAVDREQREFDATPASARAGRRFVTDTLRQHGATAKVTSDYALVVSELVTNIIEHGDGSGLNILIDVTDPDWWEIEVVGGVADVPGNLLQPDTWTVADADEASGRGLGIVRHLMDAVEASAASGKISIRCRRRRDDIES